MSLKSVKSFFARLFGLKAEQVQFQVPVEGHEYRITMLRPFKGHSMVHRGWADGTPAQIALMLAQAGYALQGEYVTIGGQRWRVWAGAVTPVDPAKRQFAGDRSKHREVQPNPCEVK
jgi:hypothetical protein